MKLQTKINIITNLILILGAIYLLSYCIYYPDRVGTWFKRYEYNKR